MTNGGFVGDDVTVELAFVGAPYQKWAPDQSWFSDVLGALRAELAAIEVDSVQPDDGWPEPGRNRVYVVVSPGMDARVEAALERDPVLAARTIFICTDSPASDQFERRIDLYGRLGATFGTAAETVRALRRRGVVAEELPLGYTKEWDHFRATSNRDIDVLFMGVHSTRRTRHLASYNRALAERTFHLQFFEDSPHRLASSAWRLGADKWELLKRARILINPHRTDEPYFDWVPALEAIHCGCVLLCEHSVYHAPLELGHHFFTGSAESLGLLADRLLDDEARLTTAARAAYELLLERRPMVQAARRLARVAIRLAAAPVPMREARHPIAQSVAPGHDLVSSEDAVEALSAVLKDAKLDLIELRRDLARLRLSLHSPDGSPPPRVRRVDWSSAWARSSGVRVSVVTALYNHAGEIREALDSLSRSHYRDFEVVIVDDGSSDGSGQVAQHWIRSHDHIPAILLQHPVNRGLGAARNTAMDFARGEHCFILDADNAIYPRCLAALVAQLDNKPDLAFAYPILELFGHVEHFLRRSRGYLTNFIPWMPERLPVYNTTDALALIRTSVLRELDGYAEDRRLYGFEDWDLWARMAERGFEGALLPRILARYRSSPGSMVSLSEFSITAAREALSERSPNLFGSAKDEPVVPVVLADWLSA